MHHRASPWRVTGKQYVKNREKHDAPREVAAVPFLQLASQGNKSGSNRRKRRIEMERKRFASPGDLRADQRGITGLETAIVLIAFVVVASVFAFAVLSTGLLSSEKSKETVLGGLEETSSTLSIRGDIVGDANAGKTAIDTVKFTLTSAAQAADAVDLSSTGVVITYLDSDQALNCTNGSGSGSSYCFWTTS
jgi:flagellin-like protein